MTKVETASRLSWVNSRRRARSQPRPGARSSSGPRSAHERQHGGREKPEGDQRRPDRAERAAEPHEGGDPGDDRSGGEHDRDLGETASELVMFEPAIGEFAFFGRKLR